MDNCNLKRSKNVSVPTTTVTKKNATTLAKSSPTNHKCKSTYDSYKRLKRSTIAASSDAPFRVINDIFQYDSCTSFPYTIMDNRRFHERRQTKKGKTPKEAKQSPRHHSQGVACNLIFCHDVFDTQERFRIFLSSLFSTTTPPLQVLLWNYPGQAYTEYSNNQLLNNVFHVNCLDRLLSHVGTDGRNEFDTTKPIIIMGYGYGGSIASLFSAKFQPSFLRGLLLVNPLTFVDTHLASIMHDCHNVFSCSPETRPDLPLYFYARFIFSEEYLERHSTPFALNMYSAVHNPIMLRGRIQLCNGVLNSVDLRPLVKDIAAPIISVHGSKSGLVRPLHASSFLVKGRTSCTSIHQALSQNFDEEHEQKVKSSVVVMCEGGHELFLERKTAILKLVKQVIFGHLRQRHYNNDIRKETRPFGVLRDDNERGHSTSSSPPLTSQLSSLLTIESETTSGSKIQREGEFPLDRGEERNQRHDDTKVVVKTNKKEIGNNPTITPSNDIENKDTTFSIDKQKPLVKSTNQTKKQEYMSWRLKRNKKRLSRFQRSAQVIQNSLRVFMAKTMIHRLKKQTSALMIQRCYRAMIGRGIFLRQRKDLWAARFVQRAYRGCKGRKTSYGRRMEIQTQIKLARLWKGNAARRLVKKILSKRQLGATVLQCLWRRWMAHVEAFHLRKKMDSTINIQRIYRGQIGRHRAGKERDKYVFSRSQSSGIMDGRQMLAEHKLHAKRLQSEISIIEKEKKSLESCVEKILKEINSFEETVQRLEKSMHELNLIHETGNYSSIESKDNLQCALREKKVELDKEFSAVIMKVTDRKKQLQMLEEKISYLAKEHQSKIDELKQLERKLIVLLEAQENALTEIRIRQERKWDGMKDGKSKVPNYDNTQDGKVRSLLKNRQTEQLMDSTETMMKFGFMSMTMTYFTSMNMVKAMKSSVSQENSHPLLHPYVDGKNEKEAVKFKDNCRTMTRERNKRDRIDLSCWNIEDVIQWLETISLSQYAEAFREGAVDGPFLCQLTDDDIRHVLGVEHILHRKKILLCIKRLSEVSSSADEVSSVDESGVSAGYTVKEKTNASTDTLATVSAGMGNASKVGDTLQIKRSASAVPLPYLDDIARWIRSKKYDLIEEALSYLPEKEFEEEDISVQFVETVGTVYVEKLERELFHLNKSDKHGNTLMHIAAQNGNIKIAKILVGKGSNPNHQNKQGQTPGHFAVAYQFYDFARWLFDKKGGGANDLMTNMYGLGPYDGLNEN